ncbi:N-acetyltransferase, partial [Dokdonella sp.]|uniref:GNAT family N-acetyltransferase n=1 Tax=Dokdonella sp. TaxID=2291710 RepID=UPI0031F32F6A
MPQDYTITRNDAHDRFETTVDGVLCVLEYRLRGDVMTITHTGVPDAVGGRGIA